MNLLQLLQKIKLPNCTCDICGREVFGGERVCKKCEKSLPWNVAPVCPFCGRSVKEEGVCLECKDARLSVDRARSAFKHEGEAARLVLRYKDGEKYLRKTLAELLLPLLTEHFPDSDALTFVPMTERAKKARGYNQSRLLAEDLSAASGKELLAVTEKKRDTEQQKSLGRRERAKNLKGCFAVTDKKRVKGKKIVLIDDTLTTGATASELAETLKRAGAEMVYLLTVTSVPYQKDVANLR